MLDHFEKYLLESNFTDTTHKQQATENAAHLFFSPESLYFFAVCSSINSIWNLWETSFFFFKVFIVTHFTLSVL